MSYSFETVYRTSTYALQKQSYELARLQEQMATGSAINRASDAPSDANRIMALTSNTKELDHFVNQIDSLSSKLDVASSLLSMTSEQITDFRADFTRAMSMGKEQRQATAAGIDDLLESLVSLANTEREGQRFFGGEDSVSKPYVVERSGGQITQVTYQGSHSSRKIEVAPNVEIASVFVGEEIFREDARQAPEIINGQTGLKIGTGTASAQGFAEVEVTHDGTNYQLQLKGSSETVTVPAGGETNTAVTDSRTGEVIYFDTTNLNSTGTESVNIPGTHDMFNLLINIRDHLNSPEDVEPQLYALADSLTNIHEKLVKGFSVIGGRSTTLEIMKEGFENVKFNADEEISRLQDADIAEVAVDLTRRETLYQMSMKTAGKLLSTSLMDFL